MSGYPCCCDSFTPEFVCNGCDENLCVPDVVTLSFAGVDSKTEDLWDGANGLHPTAIDGDYAIAHAGVFDSFSPTCFWQYIGTFGDILYTYFESGAFGSKTTLDTQPGAIGITAALHMLPPQVSSQSLTLAEWSFAIYYLVAESTSQELQGQQAWGWIGGGTLSSYGETPYPCNNWNLSGVEPPLQSVAGPNGLAPLITGQTMFGGMPPEFLTYYFGNAFGNALTEQMLNGSC